MFASVILFVFFVVKATFSSNTCDIVDWGGKGESLKQLSSVVNSLLNSDLGDLIKPHLPEHVPGPIKFESDRAVNIGGYDYAFDVQLSNIKIKGLQSIRLGDASPGGIHNVKIPVKLDKLRVTANALVHMKQLTQTGCGSNEESYLGLCYKKCSILTAGEHPLRTATNTCSIKGCRPTWELSGAVCYPKCKPKYKGVGPVCWGICSEWYGDEYKDTGLTCHRWWPPHSKSKPSYGRGVGEVWNKPWTKGLGCNGFGVSASGGCAYPYWRLCFTEDLAIKGEKDCKPKTIHADFDMEFTSPTFVTSLNVESQRCPAGSGDMGIESDIACLLGLGIQLGMNVNNDAGYNDAVKAFVGQFKSLAIESFDWQFSDMPVIELNAHSTGIIGSLLKIFNGIVKPFLLNQMFIKNKVIIPIEVAAKNAANLNIRQLFSGKYKQC